jgi:N-acetylmuramoyl-L-alanine amidase
MSRSAFAPDSCVVAEVKASPNHGERVGRLHPDMIVLHYTGMLTPESALERLTASDSEVSAHYFVHEDGRIIQLVPESRRAWHAGQSLWAGESDINSCSIGIEIVNQGHDFDYPDFPKRQIAAVTALCRSIQTRNTIPAGRVLGHSDVAPSRKQDPGEKFPWRTLADSGVGNWVKPAPILDFGQALRSGDRGDAVAEMQRMLFDYGYGVELDGDFDPETRDVVIAFQRHFRPERIDGIFDPSSRSTLLDLLAHRSRPRATAARARTAMLLAAP